MSYFIKIKELKQKNEENRYLAEYFVADNDKTVNMQFGIEALKLSLDDLEELKKGRNIYVYINGGEYALVIYVGEE